MINVSDLKPGVTFQLDGNLYVVLDYSHNKTARAAANIKVKMKNLRTGSTTELTFGGNDKVKRAQIDKKEMQYLYNTGDAFVFMDGETYEQIEIPAENLEWEKNFFQPIIIGDRCVIHSTFHRDIPQAEYDIVINPQMAFGTGHHETTSLIIGELLDNDLQGKSLLDMGCGTSILAILARMRGAAPCTAVDIDEWCVRNSLENIELNGVDRISVFQGDASLLKDQEPFDVIIANINRNILLNDMKRYVSCMHPGSELYMSGFYVDDIPVIQAEAEHNGLRFVHHKEKNRWAAVKFVL